MRDSKLQESGAGTALEQIIQASQLLQARKTEADVESVCDMCSKLTIPQVGVVGEVGGRSGRQGQVC